MAKDKVAKAGAVVLPKDAVKRADLGSSFAEYDLVRKNVDLFCRNVGHSSGYERRGIEGDFCWQARNR